jgi:hypothetical protein
MNATRSFEDAARELFQSECTKQGLAHGLRSTTLWVLHDLVGMVAAAHDRPVRELEPMIRRVVTEQNFVDECGDTVMDAQGIKMIERQVQVILKVLESVRQQALASGQWSDVPLTPQMFG